ncbi:LAME_0D06040g1_1 [Lachancea meyersii CBS 8951]|uniref:MMS19 nucleotide excision repair protein n=1 Tax=Lachancea meyersii CBS 8951 TaxID=1266667 RepID=A0A1G4J8Y3_9SACH|nr:LAME_0D06040g1_1 [Lachancea meyersii CBS 8951]
MPQEYSTQSLRADVVSVIANTTTNEAKALELASHIASKISNTELKLLELVVGLRDFITSSDNTERKSAIHCLSIVLGQLPKATLSKNDVSVVLDFYLSKFDDTSCVDEVLLGLSHVIGMKCFYSSQVASVLHLLKDEYQPTQHLAATRYFGFLILERLLERFHKNLLESPKLNTLFIETFLSIATGEKDPRNLLISFNLNSKMSTTLKDVAQFKEDLFDTLFCYFPITFKPPKNDPYKISNSDLKLALRNAISASPHFEEDAYGNLIDKMTASSPSVKNDTLLTLKACIENFGGEACFRHWLPTWNALKFEVMHGSDADGNGPDSVPIDFNNYEDSLKVLTAISAQLISYKASAFDSFYVYILDELKPNFKNEKDLKQSCSILSAIAKANLDTLKKVLADVLDLIFQDLSDLDVNKQKLLILNLSLFFDAYIDVYQKLDKDGQKVSDNKMVQYKDEILMIFGRSLKGSSKSEVSLRTLSVVQMTKLLQMPDYLSEEEVALITQYFTETILTDDNKNIYFATLEGLKAASEISEKTVIEVTLHQMMELLRNGISHSILVMDGKDILIEKVLKVLLDFTPSRHRLVTESIVGVSEVLCRASKDTENSDLCFKLLSSLYSLLDINKDVITEADASNFKRNIEGDLLAISLCQPIHDDDHNLSMISSVLFFINLYASRSTHQTELDKYLKLFVEDRKVLNKPNRSVILLTKYLSAFDKACHVPAEELLSRCVNLLSNDDTRCSTFEKISYLELLAVLSNKWCSDSFMQSTLHMKDTSMINLEITAWCTKGLVMRNSDFAVEFTSNFIELLSEASKGSQIAKLFEVFAMDLPTLDKIKGISWNNNVKVLYKQKFFGDVAPRLVSAYGSTDDMSIKANYLMALSCILKNTANKITISYIPKLLALLIQAVKLDNSDVVFSALSTIKGTVDQAPQLVTEHVHSLVPIMLDLAGPAKRNTYMVRLTAVEILLSFTEHVPLNYLLPFKDDVLMRLAVALDDKKRRVRKACVDTRQAYFELGQVPFD